MDLPDLARGTNAHVRRVVADGEKFINDLRQIVGYVVPTALGLIALGAGMRGLEGRVPTDQGVPDYADLALRANYCLDVNQDCQELLCRGLVWMGYSPDNLRYC